MMLTLKIFSCRLNCRRNFIVRKGIAMWNNLPFMLKTITFANKFKKHLKLHILSV